MQTMQESTGRQEEIPPKENRKNKVSLLYSIKLKILLLVAGVLLVATIGVLWAIIPSAKANVTELTKNY